MPKMNIYEPLGGLPAPEGYEPRRVSIGWARGQHAQIGIGLVDPAAKDKAQTAWSSDYLLEVETDQESQQTYVTQWINLDRHTINELIRALRKARDEAFGRDE